MNKKKLSDTQEVEIVKNTSSSHKKGNTIKYIIFTLIIILVIGGIGFAACYLLDNSEGEPTQIKTTTNIIEGYGITLDDLDSALYQTEYNLLRENLLGKNHNMEEYAKSVAKLFIIDLYTINNKVNKYDVGGLELLYDGVKDNYITNVTDTLYRYVQDNSNSNRNQNLPEVVSIEVTDFKANKFKINSEDVEYDGYSIKLKWSYHIDYGYDTEGEVIIINKDNKYYVVEKN